MKSRLEEDYEPALSDKLWALYVLARDKICDEVLPGILLSEPDLTDHTQRHIQNVLDNAYALLGVDDPNVPEPLRFSGVELYVLCLSIMFHDVGNVYERQNHEKNAGDVYEWVRGNDSAVPPTEQGIILHIVAAHGGKTTDGDVDTLKVLIDVRQLLSHRVRHQEIAAVLRLADELAEGPQRVYGFVREVIGYPLKSKIYHDYATITQVMIDRPGKRIVLDYIIRIADAPKAVAGSVDELKELLQFVKGRILKLNSERQYTKFYSPILDAFRSTHIRIQIWKKGRQITLEQDHWELTDLIPPITQRRDIDDSEQPFTVDKLCDQVAKHFDGEGVERASAK